MNYKKQIKIYEEFLKFMNKNYYMININTNKALNFPLLFINIYYFQIKKK